MKLLFVHQNLGAFAGAEANILITATELRARGHELGLAYATTTGKGEQKWKDVFSDCFPIAEFQAAETTAAILKEFQPDLIYLHTFPEVEAVEALVASSIPVVRMVHDHSLYCLRSYKYNPLTRTVCTRAASLYCIFPCLAPLARNRGEGRPFKLSSYFNLRRQLDASKHCQRLIVYSDYSRDELVRNGFDGSRIHVHVPIECWGTKGLVTNFSGNNRILFAGQIIRGKGVDILLKSLAKVRTPFECIVAGDGNHRAYCERLSKQLGLQDKVRFVGYLPPEELKKQYTQASVFAVSSVWPEPFGMVGPEAMRYGLPVVAFDAGGISEWLMNGENGILVPWMDTAGYARALETLLEDKEKAREMGKRGLEHVNRIYDARKQVGTLEKIFLEVASNAREQGYEPIPAIYASTENQPSGMVEPMQEHVNS